MQRDLSLTFRMLLSRNVSDSHNILINIVTKLSAAPCCVLLGRTKHLLHLFFFSFDFNENENPGVKDEIEHIVRTEAKYVKPLPELGMVNRRHVGQWLVSNENYISTVLREKILKETFTVQEYYMDDVTDRLKKIINQHLNRLAT